MKLYVCACNGWNPFEEKIKVIPQEFWPYAYNMQRTEKYMIWKELLEPLGELIAHIANPEVFKAYVKFKKKLEAVENSNGPMVVEVDNTTYASTNYHFNPDKGLVDEKGKIIMNKTAYLSLLGMSGVLQD